jgi:hypothetical protein
VILFLIHPPSEKANSPKLDFHFTEFYELAVHYAAKRCLLVQREVFLQFILETSEGVGIH